MTNEEAAILKRAVNVPPGTFLCYGCKKPAPLDTFARGAISLERGFGIAWCAPCIAACRPGRKEKPDAENR